MIRTETFTTEGKGKQNLRTALNRAEREGARFEVLPPGSARPLEAELRAISDAWLAMHNGAEKAFSLGRFDIDYLDLTPLAVMREGDRIVAFANLLVTPGEAAVDLMRYTPDAPHGVMDYLFTRCVQWAKSEGIAEFDLGMAPWRGWRIAASPLSSPAWALVFEEGGAFTASRVCAATRASSARSGRPVSSPRRSPRPCPWPCWTWPC